MTATVALGGYCGGAVGALLFGGIVAALWKWRIAQVAVGLFFVVALFVVALVLQGTKHHARPLSEDMVAAQPVSSANSPLREAAHRPTELSIPAENPPSAAMPPWGTSWKQGSVSAALQEKALQYLREEENNESTCRSYGGSPAQCIVEVAPPLCKQDAIGFANDSRRGDEWSQCLAACARAFATNADVESCQHPPVIKWDN